MKLRAFQKKRRICNRIKSIAIWIVLLAGLNLSGIIGCIEQEHITLEAGMIEALWTLLLIAVAFGIHQFMEYIASYRDFGNYIEAKK